MLEPDQWDRQEAEELNAVGELSYGALVRVVEELQAVRTTAREDRRRRRVRDPRRKRRPRSSSARRRGILAEATEVRGTRASSP